MAERVDTKKLHRRHIEAISYLLNIDPHVTGGFTKWAALPLNVEEYVQVVYDATCGKAKDSVEFYRPPVEMGLSPAVVSEDWDGIVVISILDIPKYFKRKE